MQLCIGPLAKPYNAAFAAIFAILLRRQNPPMALPWTGPDFLHNDKSGRGFGVVQLRKRSIDSFYLICTVVSMTLCGMRAVQCVQSETGCGHSCALKGKTVNKRNKSLQKGVLFRSTHGTKRLVFTGSSLKSDCFTAKKRLKTKKFQSMFLKGKEFVMNFCTKCGTSVAPGLDFCTGCGEAVAAAGSKFCPGCGKPVEVGLKFCLDIIFCVLRLRLDRLGFWMGFWHSNHVL